jgi:hypothetical protein
MMEYDRLRAKMHKDRQTFIDQDGEYWAVGNMDNFTGAVKGIAINKLAEIEDEIEKGELISKELHDKEVQKSYDKGYQDAIFDVYNILENKFGGKNET